MAEETPAAGRATAAAPRARPALGAARARQARAAARAVGGRDRRRRRPDRRRRGARGDLDGPGGGRARLHHDVAVPLRREQGRAAPAHVQRQRARRGEPGHRGRRLAVPAAGLGGHPAGHARPPSVDHPDADGRSPAGAELAALRRAGPAGAGRDRPRRTRKSSASSACSRSYTLSEARMAPTPMRAAAQAAQRRPAAAGRRSGGAARAAADASRRCCGSSSTSRPTRACTASPGQPAPDDPPVRARAVPARASTLILDGVQALIERAGEARPHGHGEHRTARGAHRRGQRAAVHHRPDCSPRSPSTAPRTSSAPTATGPDRTCAAGRTSCSRSRSTRSSSSPTPRARTPPTRPW